MGDPAVSSFAPKGRELPGEKRRLPPEAENEETQQDQAILKELEKELNTERNPNQNWNLTVGVMREAQNRDLMLIITNLLNSKLDAMKVMEGRVRFQEHDVFNVFNALPYFVDTRQIVKR